MKLELAKLNLHLETAWQLNQAATPAVSDVTADEFANLVDKACFAKAVILAEEVVGYIIALGTGVDYASENYQWFSTRYNDFVYIDRVAITPQYCGQGIGGWLYAQLFAQFSETQIACEVNLRPRNAGSLTFHEHLGFVEVGQQDTEGGTKRVALLMYTPATI